MEITRLEIYKKKNKQFGRNKVCVCYLCAGERSSADKPFQWWIVGLVVAGLVLALVGMLAYLKARGKDGLLEMWRVRDAKRRA